ncbi:MAG TPA: hypothetical protein VLK89_09155 [Solirubrobacterales bacterium]|nr:hypothetical protein [Solirubrobacterales bacterium]
MNMSKEEAAAFLEDGLADDEAHALREQLARAIPPRLSENGFRLYIHYGFDGDAAGIGFATMTEMAAELAEGAVALFDAELWYPGAALVRQLIECGYLISLAAESRDEAEQWMRSSPKEARERFSAGNMRNRAARNFRLAEYQVHCSHGGHPTPAGRDLLKRRASERPVDVRLSWSDLTQHLADLWQGFCSALPLYDPRCEKDGPLYGPHRSPDGREEIDTLLATWRERDPLARHFGLPWAE